MPAWLETESPKSQRGNHGTCNYPLSPVVAGGRRLIHAIYPSTVEGDKKVNLRRTWKPDPYAMGYIFIRAKRYCPYACPTQEDLTIRLALVFISESPALSRGH